MDNTFSYLQLCIGGYLLWCAITGTGKLYEAPRLKCSRKQYRRVLGILAGITAVFMMLDPILTLTGVIKPGTPVMWILWGLGLSGVVVMAAYNKKMVIKGAAGGQGGDTPPQDPLRAAFEFDDEKDSANPDGKNE